MVSAELADRGHVLAHLADPGRLIELLRPGCRIWLRPATDPARKTRFSAVLVERPDGRGYVSLVTLLANRLTARALASGAIPELADWRLIRAEPSIRGSRFDFLLERRCARMLVEVKSVTLVEEVEGLEERVGLFPDAVTGRGVRHLETLSRLAANGDWQATLLFVAQRSDVCRIRAAEHIDPRFANRLALARESGVGILARRCRLSLDRITLGAAIPVE